MKILWFENMKKDLIPVIKDVANFIGYHMTELKVLQLDGHLYIGKIHIYQSQSGILGLVSCLTKSLLNFKFLYIIIPPTDNFRQIFTEPYQGDPSYQSMKKFVRKGIVGDWKNYFNEENSKIWDKWIYDNLLGTGIKFPEH